eukprot:g11805.t1
MFKVQLKSDTGKRYVLDQLQPTMLYTTFSRLVAEKTGLSEAQLHLSVGFPPTLISPNGPNATLADVGVRRGETVLVKDAIKVAETPASVTEGKGWDYPPTINSGHMARREMPRDNSCLFHAIAYVCQGKKQPSSSTASEMRQLVYNIVESQPDEYNTTFLGSPNHVYRQTIVDPSSWGGAIELAIFSQLFQVEVVCFDFHHLRQDMYGVDRDLKKRVFLVYTGDHYDAITWRPTEGGEVVEFSVKDHPALNKARALVLSLHQAAAAKGECKLTEWRHGAPQNKPLGVRTAQNNSTDKSMEWTCQACTMSNVATADNCNTCQTKRTTNSALSSPAFGTASSPVMSSSSSTPLSTAAATAAMSAADSDSDAAVAAALAAQEQERSAGLWHCSVCTYGNAASEDRCIMCSEPHTATVQAAQRQEQERTMDPQERAPRPHVEDQLIGGPDMMMPPFGMLFASANEMGLTVSPEQARQAWADHNASRMSAGTDENGFVMVEQGTTSPSGVAGAVGTRETIPAASSAPQALPTEEWSCKYCTVVNPAMTRICNTCHKSHPDFPAPSIQPSRGASQDSTGSRAQAAAQQSGPGWFGSVRSSTGAAGGAAASPNQWFCPQCVTGNPNGLISCRSCRAPNPYIFGVGARGGAGGLGGAGGGGGGGDAGGSDQCIAQ